MLTLHRAAFAERALRIFKVETYKLIKEDVRLGTQYLGRVLERASEGRQPIDHDNRVRGDDAVPTQSEGLRVSERRSA